ncbi:MAG: PspA/IM30 family protein [Chloroflexi bacterium]|jgi:phage shock protein A|nr:PspA/IM30 family protein [Chloroflexota bacterium]
MASLLDRVRTLISANLNYLVSQALKANSMAVVDEYIRKVEDNLEALEDAAATVGGEAKTLKRKYEEFEAQAAELDRNIDLFLKQGKEDLAQAAQYRYNTIRRLADTYAEQAKAQEAEYKKLLDAKLKLEAKLTEAKRERTELQAMLDLAKSKELTHRVVEGVGGITASEAGIAEIREEIQRRLDKATAQGEIDAKRLDNQMAEALEKDTIDRQLAERKARLGLL